VIESHHPGLSLVHPLATFSASRLGAIPAAALAAAAGAPLAPAPPPGAFTLSLDVTAGGAGGVAAALEVGPAYFFLFRHQSSRGIKSWLEQLFGILDLVGPLVQLE
jgi:hypothetical protein